MVAVSIARRVTAAMLSRAAIFVLWYFHTLLGPFYSLVSTRSMLLVIWVHGTSVLQFAPIVWAAWDSKHAVPNVHMSENSFFSLIAS